MTARAGPEIVSFGDSAVLVILGDQIDEAVNRRVHRLSDAIRGRPPAEARFGSPVPGYASLLVPFDPLELDADDATGRLRQILDEEARSPAPPDVEAAPPVEIPTQYGGPDGPDLDEVAARAGLPQGDVVELHASVVYRVYLLGFAPGFAYLGSVPAAIATPRRATPRPRVPAGSVGIAGDQTAIYPFDTPGGWQLIGRTEVPMWDTGRDPPARLRPGDQVRFVPLPR